MRWVLLLVLCFPMALFGGDKEQRAKDLTETAEQVLLVAGGKVPFHETVEFVIHEPSRPDVTGVYRRDYLDTKHYRERLTAGDVEEVFIVDGDKAWQKRQDGNVSRTFPLVREYAPPVAIRRPEWKVKKVFHPSSQPDVECVEFKDVSESRCYRSGLLVMLQGKTATAQYSAYGPFSGKQVPTNYEVQSNDGVYVRASVQFEAGADIATSLFEPSPLLGLTPTTPPCTIEKPPVATYTPEPEWNNHNGAVQRVSITLKIMVAKDGQVHDVRVVGSLSPDVDDEAARTVRQWRFQPATCDGVPAEHEINVQFHFWKQ